MRTVTKSETALALESSRLELLDRLNQSKSAIERNRWGQFATPPELASQIVRQSIGSLPTKNQIRFLEPGFGTGSFYSALRRATNRIAIAKGIELDPLFAAASRKLWKGTGLRLAQGDFTELAPPAGEASKFNLLICNPPYVRHHHIDREKKRLVQQQVADRLQIPLSGLAGLYTHFLLLSQQWMTKGGIGTWLIPSEFMDVNYGHAIRKFLADRVTLLRIHRFDPVDVQFDDALVSSVVVFFQNQPPPSGHQVRFTSGGTLQDSCTDKRFPVAALRGSQKWTAVVDRNGFSPRIAKLSTGPLLADLFAIKRGIATGRNRFFVLNESQVLKLRLPTEFLQPILPSPRYLKSDIVTTCPDGTPDINEKRFLLSCSVSLAQVKRRSLALYQYLELGRRDGIDQGYLCRNRNPWYAQEIREPPLFLCTYMGRASARGKSPFRFIWNQSKAVAANVYLLLYPTADFAKQIQNDIAMQQQVFHVLKSIPKESLIDEGRVYGGGLHKLEPKELAKVPIDIKGLAQDIP